MPDSKPIPHANTIHNLFAGYSQRSAKTNDEQTAPRFIGDVYEQLAQLDYIYVDESLKNEVSALVGEFDETPRPVSLTDVIEGVTQLATMGVVEVTDIAEAIHREIMLRPLGRLNERNMSKWQRGISGRIYGTVKQASSLIGNNLLSGLRLYNRVRKNAAPAPLPKRLKPLVNVINGVMGDHLVTHDNPMALSMVFYDRFGRTQKGAVSDRVIVLCHGLCMSHLSWLPFSASGLGERLMRHYPQATLLYLDYNTGQRISKNGRQLSRVLQDLVDRHPNITQIDLIGHSMGGLVARSALYYGEEQGYDWPDRAGNLITLGSPHHGANLERIGYYVQDTIAKLPFANALAKLGDLRSAGIIDLRHGSIRDADWQTLEGRSVLPADFLHPAELPLHINTYLVAASIAEAHYYSRATNLLGDGLVTVASAFGEEDEGHLLAVPDGRKAVFYGVSHYNLIYSARVHEQIIAWLSVDRVSAESALGECIHSYPDKLEVLI